MRKEFERTTPEAVGLRSEDILEYIDALEHSDTEMHGLMIMRHGKVCAEGWWAPYAPNLRHGLQSHTKTYAATAVGLAYTEGLLKLDERLIDIFPEESPAEPSENLQKLTVRDVLCMGCGMDTMPWDSENWIRDFMHTPVSHVPGTTFMYNSVGSNMLGAIVRKRTGEGLHEFLTKRLFNKIGIDPDNLRWYLTGDGLEMGGGGLLATTEDNLRLMKLYADGGVWEGERLLAEDYVKLAVSNQNDSASEEKVNPQASDNFLGYGFQIWMCKPEGVYRADGAMGQFTIVVPSEDMIIAITETAVGAHWAQRTLDITWDYLARVADKDAEQAPEAENRLARKLRRLCIPAPVYQPYSPIIGDISGRKYVMTGGPYTPYSRGIFDPPGQESVKEFTLDFDNYGCTWSMALLDGGSVSLRIATYGGRFTNLIGEREDQTQLVVTDGAWTGENMLAVNLRWAETCLTKSVVFKFDGDTVELETDSNSAFKPPVETEKIVAKRA